MMITERELDQIRAEQEIYMTDTVSIRREEYIAEDETAPASVTSRARIKSGFGFFREVADRIQGITAYTITFPWDTDVRIGDVIVGPGDVEYHVRDVRDKNTYQTALQVLGDRLS